MNTRKFLGAVMFFMTALYFCGTSWGAGKLYYVVHDGNEGEGIKYISEEASEIPDSDDLEFWWMSYDVTEKWNQAYSSITTGTLSNLVNTNSADNIFLLAGGTYKLSAPIQLKSSMLAGGGENETGNAAAILDGSGINTVTTSASVVIMYGGSLNNLTIKGGQGSTINDGTNNVNSGGGILINTDSAAMVANCNITGNTAGVFGGGIFINGNAFILESTISGNSAGSNGGGIFIANGIPIIQNCTITGNRVTFTGATYAGYEGGGGVSIYLGSPQFINCSIVSNNAKKDDGTISGSEICNWGAAALFNCLVWNSSTNSLIKNDTGAYSGGPSSFDIKYSAFPSGLAINTASIDISFDITSWASPVSSQKTIDGVTHTLFRIEDNSALNVLRDTGIASKDYIAAPQFDQLGNYRGTSPDIGAVEVRIPAVFYISSDTAPYAPDRMTFVAAAEYNTNPEYDPSYWEKTDLKSTNASLANFMSSLISGDIVFVRGDYRISKPLSIDSDVKVYGLNQTKINAQNKDMPALRQSGNSVFDGIAFTGSNSSLGAVLNTGRLTITSASITGNVMGLSSDLSIDITNATITDKINASGSSKFTNSTLTGRLDSSSANLINTLIVSYDGTITSTDSVILTDWELVSYDEGIHTVYRLQENDVLAVLAGGGSYDLAPSVDQLGALRRNPPYIGALEGPEVVLHALASNDEYSIDIGTSLDINLSVDVSWDYEGAELKALSSSDYSALWSTSSTDIQGISLDNSGILKVSADAEAGTYNVPVHADITYGKLTASSDAVIVVNVLNIAPVISGDSFELSIDAGGTDTLTVELTQGTNIIWSMDGAPSWAAGTSSGNSYDITFNTEEEHAGNTYSFYVTASNDRGSDEVTVNIKVLKDGDDDDDDGNGPDDDGDDDDGSKSPYGPIDDYGDDDIKPVPVSNDVSEDISEPASGDAYGTMKISLDISPDEVTASTGELVAFSCSVDVNITFSDNALDSRYNNYSFSLDISGLPEWLSTDMALEINESRDGNLKYHHEFIISGEPSEALEMSEIIFTASAKLSGTAQDIRSEVSDDAYLEVEAHEPSRKVVQVLVVSLEGSNFLTLNHGQSGTLTVQGAAEGYINTGGENFRAALNPDEYNIVWNVTGTFPETITFNDGVFTIGDDTEPGVYNFYVNADIEAELIDGTVSSHTAEKHIIITVIPELESFLNIRLDLSTYGEGGALTVMENSIETFELDASVSGSFSDGTSRELSPDEYSLVWKAADDMPEGFTFNNGILTVNSMLNSEGTAKTGTYELALSVTASSGDISGTEDVMLSVIILPYGTYLTMGAGFRSVNEYLDTLTQNEIDTAAGLRLGPDVVDVSGLERMIQLNYLNAEGCGNLVHNLVISDDVGLMYLNVRNTGIYSLSVPSSIVSLDCGLNHLTQLDMSGYESLQELKCEGQELTADISSENILSELGMTSLEGVKNLNRTESTITYDYDTGFNGVLMDVTIYDIERSSSGAGSGGSGGGCDSFGAGLIGLALMLLFRRK